MSPHQQDLTVKLIVYVTLNSNLVGPLKGIPLLHHGILIVISLFDSQPNQENQSLIIRTRNQISYVYKEKNTASLQREDEARKQMD